MIPPFVKGCNRWFSGVFLVTSRTTATDKFIASVFSIISSESHNVDISHALRHGLQSHDLGLLQS